MKTLLYSTVVAMVVAMASATESNTSVNEAQSKLLKEQASREFKEWPGQNKKVTHSHDGLGEHSHDDEHEHSHDHEEDEEYEHDHDHDEDHEHDREKPRLLKRGFMGKQFRQHGFHHGHFNKHRMPLYGGQRYWW